MKPETIPIYKWQALYQAASDLLCTVGLHGQIDTRHDHAQALNDACFAIDGGVHDKYLAGEE